VASAERWRGNLDTGLRLCTHAARRELDLQQQSGERFGAATALAAAVFESDCN
jgi:hypothetical protein